MIRDDPEQRLPADPNTIVLDWFAGAPRASTIQSNPRFLRGLRPSDAAGDLMRVAGAVYCADKLALRRLAPDRWTRDLRLQLPVSNPSRWRAATTFHEALDFLTGDHWTLTYQKGGQLPRPPRPTVSGRTDAVCLFSGGLDSLCGAIDLLEEGKRLCLVGHYEGGLPPGVQRALAGELTEQYGPDRVELRQLFLRPATRRGEQARPLPIQRERSTRGRSLLFIAAALAVADALDPNLPVYVPENGFIGINVPLVRSRSGSLSTRTTHPYFLRCLVDTITALGITNPLRNPYRLQTKGEMLQGSRNPRLLQQLAPRSISCAHPEAARWRQRQQGNCGYCYPCLIRRAAMRSVNWDQSIMYTWDALHDEVLLDPNRRIGADLRAVLSALSREHTAHDVLRNGPIPDGEAQAFAQVFHRGRRELLAWLGGGSSARLRARLPA